MFRCNSKKVLQKYFAAELAAKKAEYEVLLEEEKRFDSEEKQRTELEAQKCELERLKAEKDVKTARARLVRSLLLVHMLQVWLVQELRSVRLFI